MKQPITTEHIMSLAAMECAASCVLTALNISGLDRRYFLLSYFHLTYYSKLIMSAKSMLRIDLEYMYGIQTKLVSGTEPELIESLQGNNLVTYLCQASKLHFFPKRMLNHDSGFQHNLLLYGYQADTKLFNVIDPVAGYIGEMTIEELLSATYRSGELIYYQLVFPETFEQPPARDMFHREAESNFMNYNRNELHTGGIAIDLFERDVAQCLQLSAAERDEWIDQNNITISSTIKTRPMIWQSFRSLNVMTLMEMETGDNYMNTIVKLWTTVNFLLIKLKRNPSNTELNDNIQQKLKTIKKTESEFLEFMYLKGCDLLAI